MWTQVTLHSITKTSDGEGGFTAVLDAGTTIWGVIQVHEGQRQLVARQEESDIEPEQIIDADGQYYRVLGKVGHVSAPYQLYDVEATDKPIVP